MQSESQSAAIGMRHDFSSDWRAFDSLPRAPSPGLPGTNFRAGKIDRITGRQEQALRLFLTA
jgi:hypothetical protein